jgi:hypothetical protein
MEKINGVTPARREMTTSDIRETRNSDIRNTNMQHNQLESLQLDMVRVIQPPTFWAIRQSGNQIIDGRTDRCITTVPMEDCLTCGTCVTCGTCSPCVTCVTCITCTTS